MEFEVKNPKFENSLKKYSDSGGSYRKPHFNENHDEK
jgi:hypothetical protein